MVRFVDSILNINLPFNYNIFKKNQFKWCRYSASFFGYGFDNNLLHIIYD